MLRSQADVKFDTGDKEESAELARADGASPGGPTGPSARLARAHAQRRKKEHEGGSHGKGLFCADRGRDRGGGAISRRK